MVDRSAESSPKSLLAFTIHVINCLFNVDCNATVKEGALVSG